MRAIALSGFGGVECLTEKDLTIPSIAPHEVLVEVAASAVNRADLLQRHGLYPPPKGASEILGLECSGRIAQVGSEVTGWKINDLVCAVVTGGGYAEYVAVPAGQLMPIPEGIDLVAAAALPEVTCTVWSNLYMLAGLREGEKILIHGGASGIGTMAIQLAKWTGAEIFTTASASKHDVCRFLGADHCIDYKSEDFSEIAKDINVVLDVMGASYLEKNMKVLAPNGRIVVIGLQGGRKTEIDLGVLLSKRISLIATTLRGRTDAERAVITASTVAHVWPLIADGTIKPVVDSYLPLAEVAAAHEKIGANAHIGKVVLVVNADLA